jgi:putative transposase
LSAKERRALVEWEHPELSLTVQTQLLGISRSSLYYRPVSPSAEEIALKHRIDEIYTNYPFFGSRRMVAWLQREGMSINRKAVQRHMREMGLEAIAPGPNLSKRQHQQGIYPYLLRHLAITEPNQVWGVDITYVRMKGGWMYLVAILDWYSRYIVSWEVDQTLEMPFVVTAVTNALAHARPTIVNSDQGSHFTSPHYLSLLQEQDIQISMDSRGRALDNIFTERIWRTIKYEHIYLNEYQSPRELRQGLATYLTFYNEQRPHQSLAYRTPAEVYFASATSLSLDQVTVL